MPSPTSRHQPARAALVGLALAATCAVSACAVGFDAQTTQVYTAPEGADAREGDVKGLNMLVVDNGGGTGTLVAALVNNADDDDSLEQVTAADVDDGGAIEVGGLDGPVELPSGTLVQLAQAQTVIELVGDPVVAGQVITINLTFTRAGAITAEVPVVMRTDTYAEVPFPEAPPTPQPGEPAPTEG